MIVMAMDKYTEQLPIGKPIRQSGITNLISIPNWKLIYNGQGLSDDEITQRWAMIRTFHSQMIYSPRRRLVPVAIWDELVEYATWMAIYRWKGNGTGKCPIKNYTWVILVNLGRSWWARHKHEILNQVELDKQLPDDDG